MKETFNEMVWRLVNDRREETMVVDNHHAYGIIKDRLDSVWEQMRMLDPEDDQSIILGGLVALATYCQLVAENLSLCPEQHGVDETRKNMAADKQSAVKLMEEILLTIGRQSSPAKELQRGSPRFKFEFGQDLFESYTKRLEEIKDE